MTEHTEVHADYRMVARCADKLYRERMYLRVGTPREEVMREIAEFIDSHDACGVNVKPMAWDMEGGLL